MRETLAEAPPAAAGVETIAAPPALPSKDVATVRNLAVDAYRGLVMLLMMGEVHAPLPAAGVVADVHVLDGSVIGRIAAGPFLEVGVNATRVALDVDGAAGGWGIEREGEAYHVQSFDGEGELVVTNRTRATAEFAVRYLRVIAGVMRRQQPRA